MALKLKNISKHYGDKEVIGNVSLSIEPGQITFFIGPNGAGKSTLLSIMSRLIKADKGEILLEGKALEQYADREVAQRLAILKQSNHVGMRLSVEDLVAFGRFPYSQGRLTDEDRVCIDNALSFMDISSLRYKFLDQLSGGQRQRVFVAMVMAQDTDYILLDEPLNNLDMRHSAQIMRLLKDMAKNNGKSIVLVIHDINFTAVHSDTIFAIKEGRLIESVSPDYIMQESVLRNIFDFNIPVHEIDGHKLGIYFNN